MIDLLILARWLHVIGATVLLGTGSGIAFFMLWAHRTHDAKIIAHVLGTVVIADFMFTTTAVIAQPLTGLWLAHLVGWPLDTPWLLLSLALYVFVGLFWLPVIWIQLQMRNIARASALGYLPLPLAYYRLFRIWFVCGFPAFAAVLGMIWLMLAKPAL
jgi:uncharacterized membrane protein